MKRRVFGPGGSWTTTGKVTALMVTGFSPHSLEQVLECVPDTLPISDSLAQVVLVSRSLSGRAFQGIERVS